MSAQTWNAEQYVKHAGFVPALGGPVLESAEEVTPMDEDLDTRSRDELVAEVRRLRAGIRAHRDSTGHDLCWHHPELWGLLPERSDPQPTVPAWPQFLRGCILYRQSLDRELPDAERTERELGR